MNFHALLIAGGLLTGLCFPTVGQSDEVGLPSEVKNSQDPKDQPLSPAESLKRITVPEGFRVSLFAGEPQVHQPIAFTFDDRGRMWVAECYSHPKWQPTGHDRILIFEDTDGDGQHDSRKVFWDQGNYITGLQWGHGGIWIGNVPHLLFLPDQNQDDRPDGAPQVVLDGWSRRNHNNVLNNLTWGPDGWLYGCNGQANPSHVGRPGTPAEKRTRFSRGVWRYHPTRQEFEVVAEGAVNPWGLDFNDHGEAFFTNCVLAHLWHLIPGAYYQRRPSERDNPYAYSRIGPCCDHLHWGGGDWTSSRSGKDEHSIAGGGHAHTGAMIYLGDNWPASYRNSILMGNIHGNRLNHDLLQRRGSGYVGKHQDDFLLGNNPWFRSLSQKYGPDGGVFISDWHDLGECHDSDGSHRSSGRIFKIVYGKRSPQPTFDLAKHTDQQLVELQRHKNDWYVRHARRILQERAVEGQDMSTASVALTQILNSDEDLTRRLRALWAMHSIRQLDEPRLHALLQDTSEHMRSWSVRLLCESKSPSANTLERLVQLARHDDSPLVRLHLASCLQRIPLDHRWDIATALVGHAKDAQDPNLPHLIWYGIEPLVQHDRLRTLQLVAATKIPLIRRHLARRLVDR